MEASAPPVDEVWDVMAKADDVIKLGPKGKFTAKLTWMGAADLDFAAISFDALGNAVDVAYFNRKRCTDGAIAHVSGDQTRGNLGEAIEVTLERVSPKTQLVAFVVMCYDNSASLSTIDGITTFATLAGAAEGYEPCESVVFVPQLAKVMTPAENFRGQGTAKVPAGTAAPFTHMPMYLDRRDTKKNSWNLTFLDTLMPGRTFVDSLPYLRRSLLFPADAKTAFRVPVVLSKDESAHVAVEHGPLRVGCGWDMVDGVEADVDLSCSMLNAAGDIVDHVYWGKLTGFDGLVTHHGDNLTGEGEGDDEVITFNPECLPQEVTAIVFVVSNYSEGNLEKLRNIHFRLVRDLDDAELIRFDAIGSGGKYTTFIACALVRDTHDEATWSIRTLSTPCTGRTVTDESVRSTLRQCCTEKTPTIKPVNLRSAYKREVHSEASAPGGKSTTRPAAQFPSAGTVQQQNSNGFSLKVLWFAALIAFFLFRS